jgi:hypothetical protein
MRASSTKVAIGSQLKAITISWWFRKHDGGKDLWAWQKTISLRQDDVRFRDILTEAAEAFA